MIKEFLLESSLEWKEIHLNRNDLLIRPGQVEKYFYFVKEGALRAYTIIDDEEFTIRLAYTDSMLTAIPSFFTGQPTDLYLSLIHI